MCIGTLLWISHRLDGLLVDGQVNLITFKSLSPSLDEEPFLRAGVRDVLGELPDQPSLASGRIQLKANVLLPEFSIFAGSEDGRVGAAFEWLKLDIALWTTTNKGCVVLDRLLAF